MFTLFSVIILPFPSLRTVLSPAYDDVLLLETNLKEVASIKGLAKNESVYAVRYLGNYGYFVTYENTDPLFTVDFSDMKNPKIVGKLKIIFISMMKIQC